MTRRPTPTDTAPTAPTVTAPTPEKKDGPDTAAILSTILAATDTAARHAVIRPLSTRDRKALTAALSAALVAADGPDAILPIAAAMKDLSTAPTGTDPAVSVATFCQTAADRFAAMVVAAAEYFGTDVPTVRDGLLTGRFDAVTDAQKDAAAAILARAAKGGPSGTRETRDRTADLKALVGVSLGHILKDGRTVTATVTDGPDGPIVTDQDGRTFSSLSAAAGDNGAQKGRVDGWSWWRTADGTADAYVREHGAA